MLEFREKAGGRCWTLRGGDRYEELGGAVQEVKFFEGNYLNPGPWRIPYHHHAVLDSTSVTPDRSARSMPTVLSWRSSGWR